MIPFEGEFSLIGTTDVPYEGDPAAAAIVPDETDYLCRVVNRYFKREITAADVVWSYAGVRPLYDDASGNASAVTRDYVFDLDAGAGPRAAPVDLRRQDHDLSQARRARAGEAAAGDGLHARRVDRRRHPARAATCRMPISPQFLAAARREHPWVPEAAAASLGARLRHATGGDCRQRQPTRGPRPRSRRRPLRGRGPLSRETTSGRGPRTMCSGAARDSVSMSAGTRWSGSRRCSAAPWRRHRPRPRTHDPAPGPGPPHRRQGSLDRHAVARSAGRASSTCCWGRRWPARPR